MGIDPSKWTWNLESRAFAERFQSQTRLVNYWSLYRQSINRESGYIENKKRSRRGQSTYCTTTLCLSVVILEFCMITLANDIFSSTEFKAFCLLHMLNHFACPPSTMKQKLKITFLSLYALGNGCERLKHAIDPYLQIFSENDVDRRRFGASSDRVGADFLPLIQHYMKYSQLFAKTLLIKRNARLSCKVNED